MRRRKHQPTVTSSAATRGRVAATAVWLYGRHPVLAAVRNPRRRLERLVATGESAAVLERAALGGAGIPTTGRDRRSPRPRSAAGRRCRAPGFRRPRPTSARLRTANAAGERSGNGPGGRRRARPGDGSAQRRRRVALGRGLRRRRRPRPGPACSGRDAGARESGFGRAGVGAAHSRHQHCARLAHCCGTRTSVASASPATRRCRSRRRRSRAGRRWSSAPRARGCAGWCARPATCSSAFR